MILPGTRVWLEDGILHQPYLLPGIVYTWWDGFDLSPATILHYYRYMILRVNDSLWRQRGDNDHFSFSFRGRRTWLNVSYDTISWLVLMSRGALYLMILSCIVVYYRVMISYHCSYDAIILWYYDNIILRPTRFVTTCLCSCRWSRLLYLALTARRFCHFLTRWLRVAVYTTNTTNPNPKPIRHNQPLVSISSPFVSYTVCSNHSGELYY